MKTLVLGGSENTKRYSYLAINQLRKNNIETVSIGRRKGKVADVALETEKLPFENIHTVTLYIGAKHQNEYYDYIIGLKPKRIIFNPGTENEEFENLARENGISALRACTLVMLSTKQY